MILPLNKCPLLAKVEFQERINPNDLKQTQRIGSVQFHAGISFDPEDFHTYANSDDFYVKVDNQCKELIMGEIFGDLRRQLETFKHQITGNNVVANTRRETVTLILEFLDDYTCP